MEQGEVSCLFRYQEQQGNPSYELFRCTVSRVWEKDESITVRSRSARFISQDRAKTCSAAQLLAGACFTAPGLHTCEVRGRYREDDSPFLGQGGPVEERG